MLEAWADAGQHWGYDVQLLGGAPNGVLFDADNKFWELWTRALVEARGRAGQGLQRVHLGDPPGHAGDRVRGRAGVAARSGGGADRRGPGDRCCGASTRSPTGCGSSGPCPTCSWPTSRCCHGAVSPLDRGPQAEVRARPARWPWPSPTSCTPTCSSSWSRRWWPSTSAPAWSSARWPGRARDHDRHRGPTMLVNGWWLRTGAALRPLHPRLGPLRAKRAALRVLRPFGLLLRPQHPRLDRLAHGGAGLCCVAAIVAIRAWRRSGDRRRLPLLVLIVDMAGFAYLGGYTPIAQIQPYRHALPLGFALLIPAGWWLTETVRARPWRAMSGSQRGLVLVLACSRGQYLVRDVLYFFAPSLPRRADARGRPRGPARHARVRAHARLPLRGHPAELGALIAWVDAHDDGGSLARARPRSRRVPDGPDRGPDDRRVFGPQHRAQRRELVASRRRSSRPTTRWPCARTSRPTAIRWVIVRSPDMSPWWDAQTTCYPRAGAIDNMLIYHQGPLSLVDGRGKVRPAINRLAVRADDPEPRSGPALPLDGDARLQPRLPDRARADRRGSGRLHPRARAAPERVRGQNRYEFPD